MAEVEKRFCIQCTLVKGDHEGQSLCGRSRDVLAIEFHYIGIDHWFNDAMRGALPRACTACLETLMDVAEGLA